MELLPLLTRAESLFKRFERSVQAIDKKDSFPAAPTLSQRRPAADQDPSSKGKSPQQPASSSSGVSGPSTLQNTVNAHNPEVISPELRQLLRKDIPWRRQQSS